ncbi:MAG: MBL fold metallo-hydrolase [Myxococcota bacterium]|nr:MBL fold metallo-hydrolase [Myxococcota bacterium]
MKVQCFTVGAFSVNTYLISDPETGVAAIVDTGETDELVQRIKALDPAPDIQMILLTHTHLDHAGALSFLQNKWDVPTYMPADDRPLFETLPMQGTMFGMPHLDRPCGRIDHEVKDGAQVKLGNLTLGFLSTPGHTPGQGCWFDDGDILVGDTLFAGSIGRTDFPMSDPQLMVESLRRLTQLPGHLRVHSGHGPMTTIDEELRNNPFLGYIRRERGIEGAPGFPWTVGT